MTVPSLDDSRSPGDDQSLPTLLQPIVQEILRGPVRLITDAGRPGDGPEHVFDDRSNHPDMEAADSVTRMAPSVALAVENQTIPPAVKAGLWLLPQLLTIFPHVRKDRQILQSVASTVVSHIARAWIQVRGDPQIGRAIEQYERYRSHVERRCRDDAAIGCLQEMIPVVASRFPHVRPELEPAEQLLTRETDRQAAHPVQELEMQAATNRVLSIWSREAQAGTARAQIVALRHRVAQLADELNHSVPHYVRTWQTVEKVFGRAPTSWNVGEDTWRWVDLAPLDRTYEALRQDKDIQRLATLVARGFDVSPEPYRPHGTHFKQATIRESLGVAEIEGLEMTDRPTDLIPTDLAMLLDPEYADLGERRLQRGEAVRYAFRRTGRNTVNLPVNRNKTRPMDIRPEPGPVLICADTSGSMVGLAETVTKGLALGIARAAPANNREAYLIAFVSRLETIDITDLKDHLPRFAAFLRSEFGNGTDTTPPLEQALRVLEDRRPSGADVVIVSDFRFPMLMSSHLDRIYRLQKTIGTRFHALTVRRDPVEDPLNVFDYRWHYNDGERGFAGIHPDSFRGL